MRGAAGGLTAAITAAVSLHAQSPAIRSLGQPDVRFDQELTRVTALREHSDGRVVVVDSKERVVHLFDPRTRLATRIGAEGAGPGEYARPFAVVSLPADSMLVSDGGNNRFLVLGPGGRILGTAPQITLSPSPGTTYGLNPAATDGKGRMYFELPRGLVRDAQLGTPIVRLTRGSERYDTVARVFHYAVVRGQSGAGRGGSLGMIAPEPFASRDEWTVSPDGSVTIVRSDPYLLERITPDGKTLRGAAVAHARVAVTAADKEEWRVQMRSRAGTLTTTTADGRTTRQTVPIPEPDSWPETKPPFVGPAMIAGDGTVWVERSRSARDTTVSYDVFAPDGKLAERVMLPASRRISGFGRVSVYVTHRDDDDVLRLERYPLRR